MDRLAGGEVARHGLPQEKLRNVLVYIDESLGESLKVRELAQHVGDVLGEQLARRLAAQDQEMPLRSVDPLHR